MRLTTLTLDSFRSYDKLSLSLTEGSHLFLGPNGSGKTNILESISLLSQARSCLRADPSDCVRFSSTFLKVRADIVSDVGEQKNLEYVFQTSPRRSSAFFINDVRTPLLDFIGQLPSIIFLPQALSVFTGPPGDRRSFLDTLITQLRPSYAAERLEYERILKQRNALLKAVSQSLAGEQELSLWDERLSEAGSAIVSERRSVLQEMNEGFLPCIQSLSEQYESLKLTYQSSYEGDRPEDLQSALLRTRKRDILLQTTTIGPHRDDWRCIADAHDIATFASRGQQRTAFLALLFVSAGLFESARHEKPVILLDDVLSELDDVHQSALLSHFHDHQVLITGTHAIDNVRNLRTWEVREGRSQLT